MAFQFDEQSVRRIVRAVMESERRDKSRQVRGKRNWQGTAIASPGRIAKTRAGGIAGRDDTNPSNPVPGSATVDFWKLDTTEDPPHLVTDGDGTAYNLAVESVAGDTWIQTKSTTGGTQFVDWEEC